jgi:hypothetical protein
MKFAKWSFRLAGIWGLMILAPFYFLEDQIGMQTPPAITHAEYFYGFIGVGLAFQIVFLIIATDPVKYRLFMLPSMLEKLSFFAALMVLHAQQRLPESTYYAGFADFFWLVLFAVSFYKTPAKKA